VCVTARTCISPTTTIRTSLFLCNKEYVIHLYEEHSTLLQRCLQLSFFGWQGKWNHFSTPEDWSIFLASRVKICSLNEWHFYMGKQSMNKHTSVALSSTKVWGVQSTSLVISVVPFFWYNMTPVTESPLTAHRKTHLLSSPCRTVVARPALHQPKSKENKKFILWHSSSTAQLFEPFSTALYP